MCAVPGIVSFAAFVVIPVMACDAVDLESEGAEEDGTRLFSSPGVLPRSEMPFNLVDAEGGGGDGGVWRALWPFTEDSCGRWVCEALSPRDGSS